MIEAKNIKLNGDLLETELKYDTEKEFGYCCYDIKNDLIVKITNIEIKNINLLYQHLILPLLKQINNNNLQSDYHCTWY